MSKVVICLAGTEALAETIIQRLKEAGIARGAVSMLAADKTGSPDFVHVHSSEAPGSTAAVGAANRGVEGSLIALGLTALEAKHYEAKIKGGNILISVCTAADGVVHRAGDSMKQSGAQDITTTDEGVCDDDRMQGICRQAGTGAAGTMGPTTETSQCHVNFRGPAHTANATRCTMNFFTKLPGFQKSPPGLERKVLRQLPRLLVLGTLFLGFPSLLARLYPWDGSETLVAMRITSIDFYMVSAITLHWRIVFTVAIAAFIVMVMKGPAYVADAYPLEDSDAPDAEKTAGTAKVRNSRGYGS